MNNSILCGSSCVKYILKYYKKDCCDFSLKMMWTTELAIFLKEKGIKDIKIKC
ncbi:MAG: hypothetical protein GX641_01075 [Mollicutes bacterium]|jgi:hypothetical protein|nr:hypothetical protein [Mollicutes bacterium]